MCCSLQQWDDSFRTPLACQALHEVSLLGVTCCMACVQAQAASAAELAAVRQELQGATEMLDSMQQMASSSMAGQEQAQQQMDALTAQLQAAIQVCPAMTSL